jgi:cell division septum initiation protein DivIVA
VDDPKKALPDGIDRRTFTVVKKGGFDQREVKVYLEDLEQAFRDLELWAQRTKDRLVLAELEVERARHAEYDAVANAMSAVFDAKDRILQRAQEEAGRIEARALSGEGVGGGFIPAAGDEAERLRLQAEQLLGDAERRADAMIAAAELRLTEARKKSAEAEKRLREANEAAGAVGGEESTWAGSAQHDHVTDLRRRLEVAQTKIQELESAKTADAIAIDRANEEAEAIVAAAQKRSAELLHQAQAAMTMPGGEAIANAQERAESIIAEAEARARQIEEAVHGIKAQANSEVQQVRDEAERLQVEADRARADATAAVGRLAEAQASYQRSRAEADDLRAQLDRARQEIDEVRSAPENHRPPDYPPAPPVTVHDAAGGIVTPEPDPAGSFEEAERPALEVVADAEPSPWARTRRAEPEPAASEALDEDADPEELSASERLRIAAQKMRRESGVDDDGPPMAGRGSRYERRSAGLPRIGGQSDFGGLRSRLSGDGGGDDDEPADAEPEGD